MSPPERQPPTSLRACGLELAEGRLVTTRVEYLWGHTSHINGENVCPVHDADWPSVDNYHRRNTGACLVTYVAEGKRNE